MSWHVPRTLIWKFMWLGSTILSYMNIIPINLLKRHSISHHKKFIKINSFDRNRSDMTELLRLPEYLHSLELIQHVKVIIWSYTIDDTCTCIIIDIYISTEINLMSYRHLIQCWRQHPAADSSESEPAVIYDVNSFRKCIFSVLDSGHDVLLISCAHDN